MRYDGLPSLCAAGSSPSGPRQWPQDALRYWWVSGAEPVGTSCLPHMHVRKYVEKHRYFCISATSERTEELASVLASWDCLLATPPSCPVLWRVSRPWLATKREGFGLQNAHLTSSALSLN